MKKMTIVLVGSTGAIGKDVLSFLNVEKNVEKIITLTRKPAKNKASKEENLTIDFSNLPGLKNNIKADVFICCLGTTMKVAGSQDEFRKVDYDYVVQFAKLAEATQAKKIIVVSALGANAKSKVFYNRIKGQMEIDVAQVHVPSIEFFRPSLLLGKRDEFRPGETLAKILTPILNPLLLGPLKKYKPIQSQTVAKAIVLRSLLGNQGLVTFESDQIEKILA